jgi:hypothetical protein
MNDTTILPVWQRAQRYARAVLFSLAVMLGATSLAAQVVINEIVYKDSTLYPSGDWVELFNAGDTSVYLSGWIVTDAGGNAYTNGAVSIPARGYLVICRDTADFHAAYPAVTNYVGPSGVALGSNDTVMLHTKDGVKEDEVAYECGAQGWPYAYGNSRSLELVYPYEDNAEAVYWRQSGALGGSPGAMNPGAIGMRVLTHNRQPDGPTSAQQVTVKIKAKDAFGTLTAAVMQVSWGGAYSPQTMTPLPSDEYELTLPATNNGCVVRYYFTLYNNLGQVAQKWWQGTNQPYLYVVTDNPIFNGLVINEIMYNSSNVWLGQGYEYVEILNATSLPVTISYWLFEDEKEALRLPAPLVLSSGWFLVLADTPAAITGVYGALPANAMVYAAPGLGLDNGGEHLKWQNANGQMIDQVVYDDKAPWPTTPDGQGPSLELLDPSLDNADPTAWAASLGWGTPGRPNSVPEPAALLWALLGAWRARRSTMSPR